MSFEIEVLSVLLVIFLITAILFYLFNLTANRQEGFMSGLGYSMGPYDNIVFNEGTKNYPFFKPANAFKTYQGTPGPLQDSETTTLDVGPEAGPIDGLSTSPRDMFMFAYNQCRPECCPSSISCDHGCVCLTDQQELYLSQRGSNSTYCTTPFVPEFGVAEGLPVGSYGLIEDYP